MDANLVSFLPSQPSDSQGLGWDYSGNSTADIENAIFEGLSLARRSATVQTAACTQENITQAVGDSSKVLHLLLPSVGVSDVGLEDGSRHRRLVRISPEALASILAGSSSLRLVFIVSNDVMKLPSTILEAGIRAVIFCRPPSNEDEHKQLTVFTKYLYRELLHGLTVADAFYVARATMETELDHLTSSLRLRLLPDVPVQSAPVFETLYGSVSRKEASHTRVNSGYTHASRDRDSMDSNGSVVLRQGSEKVPTQYTRRSTAKGGHRHGRSGEESDWRRSEAARLSSTDVNGSLESLRRSVGSRHHHSHSRAASMESKNKHTPNVDIERDQSAMSRPQPQPQPSFRTSPSRSIQNPTRSSLSSMLPLDLSHSIEMTGRELQDDFDLNHSTIVGSGIMNNDNSRGHLVRRIVECVKTHKMCIIEGDFGIGKTSCAKAVGWYFREESAVYKDGILYVNLAGSRDADDAVEALAVKSCGQLCQAMDLFRALALRSTLIILDDGDEALSNDTRGMVTLFRTMRDAGLHLVITSRSPIASAVAAVPASVAVEKLTQLEAEEACRKVFGGPEASLKTIVECSGGSPLVIKLVGGLLQGGSMTFSAKTFFSLVSPHVTMCIGSIKAAMRYLGDSVRSKLRDLCIFEGRFSKESGNAVVGSEFEAAADVLCGLGLMRTDGKRFWVVDNVRDLAASGYAGAHNDVKAASGVQSKYVDHYIGSLATLAVEFDSESSRDRAVGGFFGERRNYKKALELCVTMKLHETDRVSQAIVRSLSLISSMCRPSDRIDIFLRLMTTPLPNKRTELDLLQALYFAYLDKEDNVNAERACEKAVELARKLGSDNFHILGGHLRMQYDGGSKVYRDAWSERLLKESGVPAPEAEAIARGRAHLNRVRSIEESLNDELEGEVTLDRRVHNAPSPTPTAPRAGSPLDLAAESARRAVNQLRETREQLHGQVRLANLKARESGLGRGSSLVGRDLTISDIMESEKLSSPDVFDIVGRLKKEKVLDELEEALVEHATRRSMNRAFSRTESVDDASGGAIVDYEVEMNRLQLEISRVRGMEEEWKRMIHEGSLVAQDSEIVISELEKAVAKMETQLKDAQRHQQSQEARYQQELEERHAREAELSAALERSKQEKVAVSIDLRQELETSKHSHEQKILELSEELDKERVAHREKERQLAAQVDESQRMHHETATVLSEELERFKETHHQMEEALEQELALHVSRHENIEEELSAKVVEYQKRHEELEQHLLDMTAKSEARETFFAWQEATSVEKMEELSIEKAQLHHRKYSLGKYYRVWSTISLAKKRKRIHLKKNLRVSLSAQRRRMLASSLSHWRVVTRTTKKTHNRLNRARRASDLGSQLAAFDAMKAVAGMKSESLKKNRRAARFSERQIRSRILREWLLFSAGVKDRRRKNLRAKQHHKFQAQFSHFVRWSGNVDISARKRRKIAKMRSFWANRAITRGFKQWQFATNLDTSVRFKARRALRQYNAMSLKRGFHRMAFCVDLQMERKRLRLRIQRLRERMRLRLLRQGFECILENNIENAKQQHHMNIAIRHLRAKQVLNDGDTFRWWKSWAKKRRSKANKSRHTLKFMMRTKMVLSLHRWRQNISTSSRGRLTLVQSRARIVDLKKTSAWKVWRGFVKLHKYQRRMVSKKFMGRTDSKKMARIFAQWRTNVVVSGRVRTQMKKLFQRTNFRTMHYGFLKFMQNSKENTLHKRRLDGTFVKIFNKIKTFRLTLALEQWYTNTILRKAALHRLHKSAVRILNLKLHSAFVTWHDRAHRVASTRTVFSLLRVKSEREKVLDFVSRWRLITKRIAGNRRMISRAIVRMQTASMQAAIDKWHSVVVKRGQAVYSLRKVLLRIRHSKLASAVDKWHWRTKNRNQMRDYLGMIKFKSRRETLRDFYIRWYNNIKQRQVEVATVSRTLLRIKNLELSMAMGGWRSFTERALYARVRMNKVAKRMQYGVVLTAFDHWRDRVVQWTSARGTFYLLKHKSVKETLSDRFQHWFHYTYKKRTKLAKMNIVAKRMESAEVRAQAEALDTWKYNTRTSRRIARTLTKVALRLRNRRILMAFDQWFMVSSKRNQTRRYFTLLKHKSGREKLHERFNDWRETAEHQASQRYMQKRAMMRVLNHKVSMAFNTWADVVEGIVNARIKLDKVCRHIKFGRLYEMWTRWTDRTAEWSHARNVFGTIKGRSKREKLSDAFLGWWTFAVTSKSNRYTMTKIVHRVKNQNLAFGFDAWSTYARNARVAKNRADRTMVRLLGGRLFTAYDHWKSLTRIMTKRRKLMARIGRKMRFGKVLDSFTEWRVCVTEIRRGNATKKRILYRVVFGRLHTAFSSWKINVDVLKHSRHTFYMLKEKSTSELLADRWYQWHKLTMKSKRRKAMLDKTSRRIGSRETQLQAAAFSTWTTNVSNMVKSRVMLTKTLIRMKHRHLLTALETWMVFTQTRTQARAYYGVLQVKSSREKLKERFREWAMIVADISAKRFMKNRALCRIKNQHALSAFNTWSVVVRGLREARVKLDKVALRMKYGRLYDMWSRWLALSSSMVHSRKVMNTLRNKSRKEKMKERFDEWYIVKNEMVLERSMKNKVARRIQNSDALAVGAAFNSWMQFSTDQITRRRRLALVGGRIKGGRLHVAYEAWHSLASARKANRVVIEKAGRKMYHGRLLQAYKAWLAHVRQVTGSRGVLSELRGKNNREKLFDRFQDWEWFVFTVQDTRKKMKNIISRVMNIHLTQGFEAWASYVAQRNDATKRMSNVIRRAIHGVLAEAFDMWRAVTCDDKRRRIAMTRVTRKMKGGEQAKAWDHWSSLVAACKAASIKMKRAGNKLVYGKMAEAFEKWYVRYVTWTSARRVYSNIRNKSNKEKLSERFLGWYTFAALQKLNRSQMERVARKMESADVRSLSAAFETWREEASLISTSRRRKHKCLQRIVGGRMFQAFERWNQSATADRKKRQILAKYGTKVKGGHLLVGFEAWVAYHSRRATSRSLIRKVLRRIVHRRLSAGWDMWSEHASQMKFWKTRTRKVANKLAYGRVVAAFDKWQATAALWSHSRQYMNLCVHKTKKEKLTDAYLRWAETAWHRRRNKTRLTTTAMRIVKAKLASGFFTWRSYASGRKTQLKRLTRTVQRIRAGRCGDAFYKWYSCSQLWSTSRRVYDTIRHKSRREVLLETYISWADLAFRQRMQFAKMRRLVQRVRNLAVAQAYDQWSEIVASCAVQRQRLAKCTGRIRNRQVAAAWTKWTTSVNVYTRVKRSMNRVMGKSRLRYMNSYWRVWIESMSGIRRGNYLLRRLARRAAGYQTQTAFDSWRTLVLHRHFMSTCFSGLRLRTTSKKMSLYFTRWRLGMDGRRMRRELKTRASLKRSIRTLETSFADWAEWTKRQVVSTRRLRNLGMRRWLNELQPAFQHWKDCRKMRDFLSLVEARTISRVGLRHDKAMDRWCMWLEHSEGDEAGDVAMDIWTHMRRNKLVNGKMSRLYYSLKAASLHHQRELANSRIKIMDAEVSVLQKQLKASYEREHEYRQRIAKNVLADMATVEGAGELTLGMIKTDLEESKFIIGKLVEELRSAWERNTQLEDMRQILQEQLSSYENMSAVERSQLDHTALDRVSVEVQDLVEGLQRALCAVTGGSPLSAETQQLWKAVTREDILAYLLS